MTKKCYYFLVCLFFIPAFVLAGESSGKIRGKNYTYPVTIDGKQYTFILDTRSVYSYIDTRIADELQKLATANAKSEMSSEANSDQSSIIVNQISIGDNIINQMQFTISDFSSYIQLTGFQIDGVLGVDVYRQFIWDMDNKNKTYRIQSVNDPLPENNYQQCIYYDMADVPVITNITKDKKMISFVLETGGSDSTIDFSMIKSLNLIKTGLPKTKGQAMRDDKKTVVQTEEEDFYMENFDFENFHIRKYRFFTDPFAFPGGALGLDFFFRFDQLRLNPVNNSLCFNHFDNSSKEVLRKISVRSYAGNIELYMNDEESLKKLKLKDGDIIISINNKNYPTEEITDVRDVLTYSKTLDLQIKRHGNISHIMIN